MADAAVGAMKISTDPLFVADKLIGFGSVVVEPLRRLYACSESGRVRTLCALTLLQFGSESGVAELLETVTDDELGELIAQRLAEKGFAEIREPVIAWLEQSDLSDTAVRKKADGYLAALEMIHAKVPEAILSRLRSAPG
jgi:HEAT repeat protein